MAARIILDPDCVSLAGYAAPYLEGTITID